MSSRLETAGSNLSDRRRAEATRAAQGFSDFCDAYQVDCSPEVRPLYLTWLVDSGVDARRMRRHLAALDLSERLVGEQPWTAGVDILRWVRGIHRDLPIGASLPRCDPLYRELTESVCEALALPRLDQLVSIAATALTNETRLSVPALARLRWRDLRIRGIGVYVRPPNYGTRGTRHGAEVLLEYPEGSDLSAAGTLIALKRHQHQLGEFVVGGKGNSNDEARLRTALTLLPAPAPGGLARPRVSKSELRTIVGTLAKLTPQQVRDRVIIALGYAAALGTNEALHLRQRDVSRHAEGLLVDVPGRRRPVAVRTSPNAASCPVAAWRGWATVIKAQGLAGRNKPAFMQISGSVVWDKQMGPDGLNYLVHQRCDQADLRGDYTFTSLRVGFIRSALREAQPAHSIASHVDLRSLTSVGRHDAREGIISHSVAGMIGL